MDIFLALIDKFLSNEIDFERFYADFNALYASEESSSLSESEFAFIDAINEKLFFAAKDPSDEEKQKYNYVDAENFAEWLKDQKQQNVPFWNKYEQ
jgi:isopentenyldiphosphate isomerase